MAENNVKFLCERCVEEEANCILDIYKHSVFIEQKTLCKECFEHCMIGGEF